jgi:rhamnose transport system permease protein
VPEKHRHRWLVRYRHEVALGVGYLLLLVWLAVWRPAFFQPAQLQAVLVSAAPMLVVCVGMTLVILARQIDIAVGSLFSVCGVAVGLLARGGWPMPLAGLAAVGLGTAVGAFQGWLVAYVGLPAIVVTLAMMVILREGLRWWRQGEFVRDLPTDFQWFGFSQEQGQLALVAIALGCFVLVACGLRWLAAGRAVYATGGDPHAAFLAGMRPRRVTLAVFSLLGGLTGLAAVLHTVRFAMVDPAAGQGLELQAIAAVVLGGVAISGGRGTLVGPLLGVFLLATLKPALVFLGAAAHWDKALQGAIILAAVAASRLQTSHAAAATPARGRQP